MPRSGNPPVPWNARLDHGASLSGGKSGVHRPLSHADCRGRSGLALPPRL